MVEAAGPLGGGAFGAGAPPAQKVVPAAGGGWEMPTAPPPPVAMGWETPTAPPPSEVVVSDSVACPRCAAANEREMRFCKECGFRLPPAEPARAAAAAPASTAGAPTCWRCHALGDMGALFCKFCGAAYKDSPGQAGAAAPGAYTLVPPEEQQKIRAPSTTKPQPSAHPGPMTSVAARLVAILKDGSDGRVFPINSDQTDLGRKEGDIILADDPYLSPRHMRIRKAPEGFIVRDLESINGVYMRIREPVDLADGDMLLLGQQVIRFELLDDGEQPLGPAMQNGVLLFGTPEVPRIARLTQYTTEGVGRDVHYLYRDETVVGRENGDIVFTDDPFMSRRHAAISVDRNTRRFVIRDLGSSNGSAIRFFGEKRLNHGDQIRVGRHLFRFDVTSVPGGFGSR